MLNNFSGFVVTWANESHVQAKSAAYDPLPAHRTGNWSQAYQEQAWPVVSFQLQKASVRLAEVLNETLK
jgi:hypothetical protein